MEPKNDGVCHSMETMDGKQLVSSHRMFGTAKFVVPGLAEVLRLL